MSENSWGNAQSCRKAWAIYVCPYKEKNKQQVYIKKKKKRPEGR